MANANISNFKLYNSKHIVQAIVLFLNDYVKIDEVDASNEAVRCNQEWRNGATYDDVMECYII